MRKNFENNGSNQKKKESEKRNSKVKTMIDKIEKIGTQESEKDELRMKTKRMETKFGRITKKEKRQLRKKI